MPAKVYHYDLYGKRKDKYKFLSENSVETVDWKELQPDEKYHFFVPKDFALQEEYEKGVKVSELFEVFNSGVETQKDSIAIKFTKEDLAKVKQDFLELENQEILDKYKIKESRDWEVNLAREDLKNTKTVKINYRPFDFRYTEYSGKSKGFMAYPRHDVSKHFLQDNLGLTICRRQTSSWFRHILITNSIAERCYNSLQTGEVTTLFPLYLYPDDVASVGETSVFPDGDNAGGYGTAPTESIIESKPKPNFNPDLIKQIEQKLEMELDWEVGIGKSNSPSLKGWQPEADGVVSSGKNQKTTSPTEVGTPPREENLETFTPTDLLDYIYSVLHSPSYREKYKEFLKIDFPRVPFPPRLLGKGWGEVNKMEANKTFWKLVSLGSRLRKLHLLEGLNDLEISNRFGYPVDGNNFVEKPRFVDGNSPSLKGWQPQVDGVVSSTDQQKTTSPDKSGTPPQEENFGKVYINETQYFDNVPESVWNFYIGGYQPAQKWLKDRKGMELGFADITHYQKILHTLAETEKLMNKIDEIKI